MKSELPLREQDIIAELTSTSKDGVLIELAEGLAARHPSLESSKLLKLLQERERLGSTGIGDGIAIPHCKDGQADSLLLIFGRSPAGVDFDSLDGKPAHLFFLLVAPETAVGVHLKMLARISRILKVPAVRKGLLEASDAVAIASIIREQDSRY